MLFWVARVNLVIFVSIYKFRRSFSLLWRFSPHNFPNFHSGFPLIFKQSKVGPITRRGRTPNAPTNNIRAWFITSLSRKAEKNLRSDLLFSFTVSDLFCACSNTTNTKLWRLKGMHCANAKKRSLSRDKPTEKPTFFEIRIAISYQKKLKIYLPVEWYNNCVLFARWRANT